MYSASGIVCINAWYWVDRERKAIMKDMQDDGEAKDTDDA
jgi:hypothetical protein